VRREATALDQGQAGLTLLSGELGSPQEWTADLEAQKSELAAAWEAGERVKALQLTIHCLKSLSDTSPVQFYPAKFFQASEVLEQFRQLVTGRLAVLPVEQAQETASNWHSKVCSVRELVPRLLLEAALHGAPHWPATGPATPDRLGRAVRGLGDPLLAAYTGALLLRLQAQSGRIRPAAARDAHLELAVVLGALREDRPSTTDKILFPDYLQLLWPAVSWTVLLLVRTQPEAALVRLIKENEMTGNHELALRAFLLHLPGELVAQHAALLLERALAPGPHPALLAALGGAMLRAGPAAPRPLEALTQAWAAAGELGPEADYLPCVAVWLEFAAVHFSPRELGKLLLATVRRLQAVEAAAWPGRDAALGALLHGLLGRLRAGAMELLRLPGFLPALALFAAEEGRVAAAREVLEALGGADGPVEDRLTIDVLGSLARTVAGAVTALTPRDEERQVSELVIRAVAVCSLLPDRRAQLSLLTEQRAAFCHLDLVQAALVRQVHQLAGTGGGDLAPALAAFAYITVPSLRCRRTQLSLQLETAQACLVTGCLGQAEASLRAAIQLVGQTAPGRLEDGWLLQLLPSLLSALLAVPDSPDRGPLHLARAALNALNKFPWAGGASKALSLVAVLRLLGSYAQPDYPYHYPRLPANDQLYGSHPDFLAEVTNIASTVLRLVQEHIAYLVEARQVQAADTVRLELLQVILLFGDAEGMGELGVGLAQGLRASTALARREREGLDRQLAWRAATGERAWRRALR
jgi:hypothetical protein